MNEAQLQAIKAIQMRYSIIGNSTDLQHAIYRAMVVATSDFSTLINGESGSGKEVFPKIIHDNSPRRHSKYIAVNCGAIPEGTIDSELFGHEKGAFTGADKMHKGYFEETDNGTIFLDEVAELPLPTQARLLRVLESGEYMRMGSTEIRRTNVRVIAATNRDLLSMVKEGKFREDLYYRISTVVIKVPPLRKRGEDIILLAKKFLYDARLRNRSAEVTLTKDAEALILSYNWPGNVRQLKNTFENLSLFEAGNKVNATILKEYLPDYPETGIVGNGNGSFDYGHDRAILFEALFRLGNEVDALKKELVTIKQKVGLPKTAPAEPKLLLPEMATSAQKDVACEVIDVPPTTAPATEAEKEDAPVVERVKGKGKDDEEARVREALLKHGGNRAEAAKELGMSERTIYRKMEKYGIKK